MKILVVMRVTDAQRERLMRSAGGAELVFASGADVTAEMLRSADAVIGNMSPKRLAEAPELKWVQLGSAGVNGYTADGPLPSGTVLTNASGAYGLAISEHMLACLLFLMKNLGGYAADQAGHVWQDRGPVTSVWGSRTLVVGAGDIGTEFARRMHALGSRVTGIRRHPGEKPDCYEAVLTPDRLTECLAEADVVADCLPGTQDTAHVFDRAAFAAMKRGAYFLNVGRGGTVDSYALADALNSGRLAGASVDVTEPEPLPPEHPLWSARNVLITPHVSGGGHLYETTERIVDIAAENLSRFVSGRPLINVVDRSAGYRHHESERPVFTERTEHERNDTEE